MDFSDSEDEFFDAIDDTAPKAVSPPRSSSPQPQCPSPQSFPTKKLYKSEGSKSNDSALADFCTGSTLSFQSREVSEPRMLPFGLNFRGVQVRTNKKEFQEFAGLMLAQELTQIEVLSIWCMKFSPDGRFLTFSGESGVIYLYEVARDRSEDRSLPLLQSRPSQVYRQHSQSVVDLSWSRSSTYFASAGLDAEAIVWRVDSPEPLMRLIHPKMVTSVAFNPHVTDTQNPVFVATGCADLMVRIWSVADGRVDSCYRTEDLVTCMTYSPPSTFLFVGMTLGQVLIYESQLSTAKLKYSSTLSCRNRHGRKSRGRKVTGVEFFDESTTLISTNDSRGRLFTNGQMLQKYKGHKSEENCIRLSFSQNLQHVVGGSENGKVFIWNTYNSYVPNINPKYASHRLTRAKADRNCSYESFDSADGREVLCTVFAPDRVVRDLQERGAALKRGEIVSHVLVTGGADGIVRIYYNCHPRVG